MRALFWILLGLGLVILARQIWIVDAHFLVTAEWVVPYGLGVALTLALIGAIWGWRISSQPIRKHERDQFRYDYSPSRVLIGGGLATMPTSQLPSIILSCLGFLSWGSVGFYAPPMAAEIAFGETQVTPYEVVELDYSNRARGFVVRSNGMSSRLSNVPSWIFLEAELGDTVLLIGQGTSLGQYYHSIELR